MAYDASFGDRLREKLVSLETITEKEMFGGLAFMYREKMLCCLIKRGLMCRVDPSLRDELLEQNGVSEMRMKQTVMKGFVLVDTDVLQANKALKYWIDLCLAYNPKAKSSKKK